MSTPSLLQVLYAEIDPQLVWEGQMPTHHSAQLTLGYYTCKRWDLSRWITDELYVTKEYQLVGRDGPIPRDTTSFTSWAILHSDKHQTGEAIHCIQYTVT